MCNTCHVELPLERFYNNRKPYTGKVPRCKDCHNKRCRELKPLRPLLAEQQRIGGRKHKIRKAYGISLEVYDLLLHAQDGVCAICKQPETSKTRLGHTRHIAVDHDHKDGKVRGLLCTNCNNGIGRFRDNPALLIEAARYLVEHESFQIPKPREIIFSPHPLCRSRERKAPAEESVGH